MWDRELEIETKYYSKKVSGPESPKKRLDKGMIL